MKVCIVSSCGGHLTEVRRLMPAYGEFDHFYVLDDTAILPSDMVGRTYFITRFKRDPVRILLNVWEAFRILSKERPHVILSTGAGGVVPFAIIGRFLFRVRIIYIETLARPVTPSMTGRIMYYLAHRFFYQWETLRRYFPKGEYGGLLF
jgi:UDP-N-acetylglucosamine:LPS N-acetylglucosamine transferase